MIISLRKRFIFVANLKCASTAIEDALKEECEIRLLEAELGKHWPLRLILEAFAWTDHFVPRREMFVFGVLRNPVDYLRSLYLSHRDPRFRSTPILYTGEMGFDDFLDIWCVHNEDQASSQSARFLDTEGRLAANYVVSFGKLKEGLAFIADLLELPQLRSVKRMNVSPADQVDIGAAARRHIEDKYGADYDFLDRYCDRLLVAPLTLL